MKNMFEHILLPVDFTEKNAVAIDVALQLAVACQSRVTLLHVIERIGYAEDEEIGEFYNTLEAKAQENLAEMAGRFFETQLSVRQEILFGRRGPEIVRYAAQQDVDLVVLSSHKVNLAESTESWATLSYQVSILCPAPVLLVK